MDFRLLITLVWRNLWRNRTRSWITLGSVFAAVLLATSMQAIQRGVWDRLLSNVTGIQTGQAQIQSPQYWDDKVLDHSFAEDPDLVAALSGRGPGGGSADGAEGLGGIDGIDAMAPRLESFALASTGGNSQGCLIMGIDPEAENAANGLADKVAEGRYLKGDEAALLLGRALAKKLNVGVGDTLVFLGQGYHGVTAAGKYPVAGLLQLASPDIEARLAYLPLRTAQTLFGAEGRLTSYALFSERPRALTAGLPAVRQAAGNAYAVLGWEPLLPELHQSFVADSAGFFIMIGVLYLIIGFGIFGTLLMMANERRREFGMLISLGMGKGRLALTVFAESLLLCALGVIGGVAASLPWVHWFAAHPIRLTGQLAEAYREMGFEPVMPATTDPAVLAQQGLFVLALASLLSLAPAWKAWRLDPREAMRK